MLKILYAACNRQNSKIALQRFMNAIKGKPYIVKIAAYKKSSPNINIDWTLDSLNNIFGENIFSFDNDNLRIYFEQVKAFNPDLIISDLEHYTSHIANLLNIPLWQCSPSILDYSLTKKQKIRFATYKIYYAVLYKNENSIRNLHIINNSDRKLIYSHFCDIENPPEILDNYEWVRPYHTVGKISPMCYHNIVCSLFSPDKKIISFLKDKEDVVLFSQLIYEKFNKISLKNIENESEYFCNLQNSRFFISEGHPSFLADAFYNNKKSFLAINYEDTECLLHGAISEKLNLSKILYKPEYFTEDEDMFVEPKLNKNAKYLHERIEEFKR